MPALNAKLAVPESDLLSAPRNILHIIFIPNVLLFLIKANDVYMNQIHFTFLYYLLSDTLLRNR